MAPEHRKRPAVSYPTSFRASKRPSKPTLPAPLTPLPLIIRLLGQHPVFPEIILARIFYYYFNTRFCLKWHRDWLDCVTTLTLYNTKYRDSLDRLIPSSSHGTPCPLRTVVRQAFWAVLGAQSSVKLSRRHNVIYRPWAYPGKAVNKHIKRVEIVMNFADRKEIPVARHRPYEQGDIKFLRHFMSGGYGFENVEQVVLSAPDMHRMRKIDSGKLEQYRFEVINCVAQGMLKLRSLKRVVWLVWDVKAWKMPLEDQKDAIWTTDKMEGSAFRIVGKTERWL